jgi:hypothetical protein
MKSIIGNKTSYNTTKDNPYTTYMYGIKEEGARVPAIFSSPDLAMNALMQNIIDKVLENKYKNIIWRQFPEVSEEKLFDTLNEPLIFYKAYARFCFE